MEKIFTACLKAGMTPDTIGRIYLAYAMGDTEDLNKVANLFRNHQGVYNMISVIIYKLKA